MIINVIRYQDWPLKTCKNCPIWGGKTTHIVRKILAQGYKMETTATAMTTEEILVNAKRIATICAELYAMDINPLRMIRQFTGAKVEFGHYQGNDMYGKHPVYWNSVDESLPLFIGVSCNEDIGEVAVDVFKNGVHLIQECASSTDHSYAELLAEAVVTHGETTYRDRFYYRGGPFSGQTVGEVFDENNGHIADRYIGRMTLANFISERCNPQNGYSSVELNKHTIMEVRDSADDDCD